MLLQLVEIRKRRNDMWMRVCLIEFRICCLGRFLGPLEGNDQHSLTCLPGNSGGEVVNNPFRDNI